MKTKFNVKGMHCPSCEMLITDSLNETKGVKDSKASNKKGIVEVEFDDKVVSVSELKKVIEKEGYNIIE